MKNQDLNGLAGVVVPETCSQQPPVQGCVKVKLESGREVAVKPQNVHVITAAAPEAAEASAGSQEQLLQQVLAQIKTEAKQSGAPDGGAAVAGIPPIPAELL